MLGFCLTKSVGTPKEQQGGRPQISFERMWMKPTSSNTARWLKGQPGSRPGCRPAGWRPSRRRHDADLDVLVRVQTVLGPL